MKHLKAPELQALQDEFKVVANASQSQFAIMVLQPGEESGPYGNGHPESDQVLIVTSGWGSAKVSEKTMLLEAGDVLLIDAGEHHQITAGQNSVLRTFNVYSPPAY